ncbi:MAG: hypothetical protein COX65_05250 [Elusimicrobia bacterium CG_4_10_14_0_2_um_filter_56_8]|nr:MAG: hypothetical protein AUJ51_03190 [Elusimicrobia bacterium CG1_02_56_21]PJA14679.1 MAG: hypothetical protein COX65_05250 [Elusimicrobia bacterium CG_4_10_14_0_2_um_filter_56_8]
MIRTILFSAAFGLVCGASSAAQEEPSFDARLAGSPVYSDPGFQEYIETAYGYLNPENISGVPADLRDAVASPPAGAGKTLSGDAEEYVFVSILPKTTDYTLLLGEIHVSAGFVLTGERTAHSNCAKKTRIIGWAKAAGLASIRRDPGVAGVRVERPGASKAASQPRTDGRGFKAPVF